MRSSLTFNLQCILEAAEFLFNFLDLNVEVCSGFISDGNVSYVHAPWTSSCLFVNNNEFFPIMFALLSCCGETRLEIFGFF